MRHWTNTAINNARETEDRIYKKLASYEPDEKLTRDDIGNLLYILRHYDDELESILHDRKKTARLMNK